MKIKLLKENLLEGIQIVQNVVSNKSTLPILSNILLETRGNMLKLYSTDLDIGVSCEIPVEIIEEGAITIPAKRFSDIIKEMPVGDITISAKKNNQVDIEGNKCRFKLLGLPKEEFPKFPEFKDKEIIKVEQKILKEMIRMTSFSVSHEESRYILNGIFFEIANDNISLVATDGKRLAKMNQKIGISLKKDLFFILPIKAIHEISRNLKDEGTVSLIMGSNQILFDIDGILIATRVIEGEFPNYKQVIPTPITPKIKIDTQYFLSAIRRANLLATPDFQAIKIEVFSDKIVVSKTTPDVGESREEVLVQYGGKELIVGFNPLFLIDFLKNINEKEIELELSGSDKAGVIRFDNYIYLVLPMRI